MLICVHGMKCRLRKRGNKLFRVLGRNTQCWKKRQCWVAPPCPSPAAALLSGGLSLAGPCWQIMPWARAAHQKTSYSYYSPCDNAGNHRRGRQLAACRQWEALLAAVRWGSSGVPCTWATPQALGFQHYPATLPIHSLASLQLLFGPPLPSHFDFASLDDSDVFFPRSDCSQLLLLFSRASWSFHTPFRLP